MTTGTTTPASTSVRELAEFLWEQSPGHHDGALSKILVSAATTPGAKFLDFRVSTYAPKAYVHTHVHPNKEQIYFFLEGEGVLELGTEKKVVRPNQFAFIPPHLPHGLHNTGNGQLVFIVITTLTERG
jgi:mannose-6-phosphate isomerase-like protein (cupin superfamily)